MSQNPQSTRSLPEALTIVLTGGGSGGHITPLLSLGQELRFRKPKSKLVYIGFKGDNLAELKNDLKIFDKTYFISAGKLRRYSNESLIKRIFDIKSWVLNTRDLFRVVRGVLQSRKILRAVKPDIILLKGGFVSVPVAIAAAAQRIPTVTHDSDSTAGLANRIASKWAVLHATGMPAEYYNYPKSKVRYVGIPLDPNVKPVDKTAQDTFKDLLGISKTSQVLLITGGGLGSQRLNDMVLEVVPKLLDKYPNLFIIHVTGEGKLDVVNNTYSSIISDADTPRLRVIGFTDEFYKYSGAADIIITRAGATSLAQFAAQHKACIVIPSPYLTGGHQLKNAGEYASKGAVINMAETSEPSKLMENIELLMNDTKKRHELGQKLGSFAQKDAAQKLADVLLEVAARH